MIKLFNSDCLEILRAGTADSIDALVTDPPAGISFMGKSWDDDKGGRDQWVAWMTEIMTECLRVMKPGAHGLVWALPRTSHWTAIALENAGFEVRDVVTHLFGTGFPKSMDISKAIDKAAGAKREIVGTKMSAFASHSSDSGAGFRPGEVNKIEVPLVGAPATDAAKQWQGWGTALKPASEHWILIRKPCSEKTVAANVLKHGTGGINIDASRIGMHDYTPEQWAQKRLARTTGNSYDEHKGTATDLPTGRFPANLILDEEAAAALDEQSGITKSPKSYIRNVGTTRDDAVSYNKQIGEQAGTLSQNFGDSGGASRFFYVAKASKSDKGAGNTHPTVKSTALMTYLIKLITPSNGTILDPFMGSGSTGVAAVQANFGFVGIERELEYYTIASKRLGITHE